MKDLVLICLFASLTSSTCFSQNLRTGSFIPDSPTYPISGDVSFSQVNGIKTVTFESNFSTIQGITLEVFLSKTNVLDVNTDVKISILPLDDGSPFMSPITGMRTFAVPANIDLFDFDNIIVQCTSANLQWGYANICEPLLDVTLNPIPDGLYRAAQDITSQTSVAAPASVRFESAQTILLNGGFEVPHTSAFVAHIDSASGCTIP